MDFNQFHFAHPYLLWGLLIIPSVWIIFFIFYRKIHAHHQLEKFIDPHLLPYLLVNNHDSKSSYGKTLLLWSIIWMCLTLALAGPRWSFREMETFSQDKSLVILLDLSESMNASDLKPSRLVRAKQKIEDLLNLSKGLKIGLIAFAADSHMMSPLTEDKETIRHLLPSLDTDLILVQGSRLSPALDMAFTLLQAEPGSNKAVLVISDGGFEDSSAIMTAKKLAEKGIVIHAMGMGTAEGAPLYNKGGMIKKNGAPILSKLDKERLNEVSKAGNGRYMEAHYADLEEKAILDELDNRANAQMNLGKKNRFWDEHFYVLIVPVLPILLYWFRRGALFSLIILLVTPSFGINASDFKNYFKNSEERGKETLDEGDCEAAVDAFQDPYRKGVAYYKAKNYAEAEKMFDQSIRSEVSVDATYNLGNALVQQNKLKEAMKAYKKVLKCQPEHAKAKENLALVKEALKQQRQEGSNGDDSDEEEQEDQDENQSEKDSKNKNSKKENNRDKKQDSESSKDDKEQSQTQDGQEDQEQKGCDGCEKEDEQKDSDAKQEELNQNQEEQKEEEQEVKERQGINESEAEQKEGEEGKVQKSQEDQDADFWLDRITNDPKTFLKNKFSIESKKNGTKGGIDPW